MMGKNRMIGLNIIICLAIILGACMPNDDTKDIHLPTIYTSIYPIQFIVEQLAGDVAHVISVYPPGVDAHTYEPTMKEIIDIAHGEAFIYLGAGMEGFADRAADALSSSDVQFIEVGKNTKLFKKAEEDEHHDDHDHGDYDPHIWFDPLRMIEVSEIIMEQLFTLLPHDQELIEENFNTLRDQLIQLDEEYLTTMREKSQPQIIVSHAAYGYWEERYNIKQIPISGLTSGDEPSQKDLAYIIELAEQYDIEYVLFEKNTTNRLATIIQQHLGAKDLYIHNLENLVDEEIEDEEDYFSLMRANLEVIDQTTK